MSGRVVQIALVESTIDTQALQQAVSGLDKGGVVAFTGVVRNDTEGTLTEKLFYEAHTSMALTQMRRIAHEASERWNANVALVHRIGELLPGDVAVVCVAACSHRAEAFECCRYLIDRIKADVPIWKKEFGSDGEGWISSPVE